jgi:hypothetical protein
MAGKSTGVGTDDEPTAVSDPKIVGRTPRVWQAAHRFSSKGVLVSNVITVWAPAVTIERRAGSV